MLATQEWKADYFKVRGEELGCMSHGHWSLVQEQLEDSMGGIHWFITAWWSTWVDRGFDGSNGWKLIILWTGGTSLWRSSQRGLEALSLAFQKCLFPKIFMEPLYYIIAYLCALPTWYECATRINYFLNSWSLLTVKLQWDRVGTMSRLFASMKLWISQNRRSLFLTSVALCTLWCRYIKVPRRASPLQPSLL